MELLQWSSYLFGMKGGWGTSAFTPEDLISDWQGATFGKEVESYDRPDSGWHGFAIEGVELDKMGDAIQAEIDAAMKKIIEDYLNTNQSPYPSYRSPMNVAEKWNSFLMSSGAVNADNQEVRGVLLEDAGMYWNEHEEYTGPRPKTLAAAQQFRLESEAYQALCYCNGSGGDVPIDPTHRYPEQK